MVCAVWQAGEGEWSGRGGLDQFAMVHDESDVSVQRDERQLCAQATFKMNSAARTACGTLGALTHGRRGAIARRRRGIGQTEYARSENRWTTP